MKLNILIQLYKSMFCIQDHTKDFQDIIGYTWKWLDMYFKLCFMVCFHRINFNAVCDAYVVQRQSYTVLLKSNRILASSKFCNWKVGGWHQLIPPLTRQFKLKYLKNGTRPDQILILEIKLELIAN